MIKEIKRFENYAGAAIIYIEDGMYSVERRTCQMPGIFHHRVFNYTTLAAANKKFNTMKRTLRAMQANREQKR